VILYLFDIDGTLVRAGGAGGRALDRVLRDRYGLDRATRGIRFGGKTDPLILEEVLAARLGRAPAAGEIEAILDAYVPVLDEELAAGGFRVLPGAAEILDWLGAQPRVALGLATGNVTAGARAKLARAGLWERFAFGGFGSDSAVRAELVAHAIARGEALAGRARAVVVVGDTLHDVSAGKACGAVVVAVTTGADERDVLAAAGADAVLDGLEELSGWHQARFA
jgi:phosphoglycolate phosphatase-like HAD superfamily hydrolase